MKSRIEIISPSSWQAASSGIDDSIIRVIVFKHPAAANSASPSY